MTEDKKQSSETDDSEDNDEDNDKVNFLLLTTKLLTIDYTKTNRSNGSSFVKSLEILRIKFILNSFLLTLA